MRRERCRRRCGSRAVGWEHRIRGIYCGKIEVSSWVCNRTPVGFRAARKVHDAMTLRDGRSSRAHRRPTNKRRDTSEVTLGFCLGKDRSSFGSRSRVHGGGMRLSTWATQGSTTVRLRRLVPAGWHASMYA